jgi:hypothetical protein
VYALYSNKKKLIRNFQNLVCKRLTF